MSYPLLHTLFCFLLLLPFSTVAQTNGTVDVGASITAGDNSTNPWLSASQDFAFGFKQLQDNYLFLLCIWYYEIPDKTIVWYANKGVPVLAGSKVEITADKGLVLSDSQGRELWNSTPIPNQVANGFMSDTGSFVLVGVGGGSVNIWESFKYPTDTLLPTQIMESGGVLFSRQSEKNFSSGRKLVEEPYSKSVDWSKWQVFWVDERMVPPTDKDSNYKLAYDGFLSKVPIPPTNIHAVNVKLPAAAAAEAYQTLIKTLVDNKTIDSSSSSASPRFDLMLLTMGPDGHVASLFPGHPLLKEKQRWVAAVKDAPFPPRERVTFTFPVINSAANFGFVITASDLPEWVKAILAEKVGKAVNGRGCGEGEGLLLPVEMVKPRGEMRWFLDNSTAAKIEG